MIKARTNSAPTRRRRRHQPVSRSRSAGSCRRFHQTARDRPADSRRIAARIRPLPRSVVPAHTPFREGSARAKVRHSTETGQAAQMRRTSWLRPVPSGKNSRVSRLRQAERACQRGRRRKPSNSEASSSKRIISSRIDSEIAAPDGWNRSWGRQHGTGHEIVTSDPSGGERIRPPVVPSLSKVSLTLTPKTPG
jgi:hypothetical protein